MQYSEQRDDMAELVQRHRAIIATNKKFLTIWQVRHMRLWQQNTDGSESYLTEQSILLLRANIEVLAELIERHGRGQL
jgi:hypothetical protein